MVNFYTGGQALNGFFLGPLVGYQFGYASASSATGSQTGNVEAHALKIGGRLGRQWFPTSWMVINLSGGASYLHQVASNEVRTSTAAGTEKTTLSLGGFSPDLKFGLGVRF